MTASLAVAEAAASFSRNPPRRLASSWGQGQGVGVEVGFQRRFFRGASWSGSGHRGVILGGGWRGGGGGDVTRVCGNSAQTVRRETRGEKNEGGQNGGGGGGGMVSSASQNKVSYEYVRGGRMGAGHEGTK